MPYLLRGLVWVVAFCTIGLGYALLVQAWRGHPDDAEYSRAVRVGASVMAVLFGLAFASGGVALVLWMIDHA